MIITKVLERKCAELEKCFFAKMVADYYRYMAENTEDKEANTKAQRYYEIAMTVPLHPCNPIKLGLILNFSLFLFHTENKAKAMHLSENALENIDGMEVEQSKVIIDLIRGNL